MSHLSYAACTMVLAGVPLVACGARTGLLVLEGDGGPLPSCTGTEIPLQPNVPNVYFVLDVSASMKEMNKWTNVRTVVGDLITQLGGRAQFGATVFPGSAADVCSTGMEVMPLQLGDSAGAAAAAFQAATNLTPNGGTPTATTFEALMPRLQSLRQLTYAILATDGGPNCDAMLTCNVDTCTSNIDGVMGCPSGGPVNCCQNFSLGCLDGVRTASAVGALHAAGVETFVLGIPGSAPYAAALDQMAQAGGTARATEPYYYRVDTADTAALAGALAEIAAKLIASCRFVLTKAPADPNRVNVNVAGSVVPRDGPDGWSLSGDALTVEGATCQTLQSGGMPAVHVLDGCPTVTSR